MESRKRGSEPPNQENPKAKRLRRTQILRNKRPGIWSTKVKQSNNVQQISRLLNCFLHVTESITCQPPNRKGKIF